MRLLTMAGIGLKSSNSLSHDNPSEMKRTVNVSDSLEGVSISVECVRVVGFLNPALMQ